MKLDGMILENWVLSSGKNMLREETIIDFKAIPGSITTATFKAKFRNIAIINT